MNKIIFLLVWGCLAGSAVCMGQSDSRSDADAESIHAVVAGNTDFSLALYGKLTDDSTGNFFFSPYSISTALAMVYAGARGQTQKQMASALCFTMPADRLASVFGTLQKNIVQEDKSHGYQILSANALWVQKGNPFLNEFLDLTQKCYGAGLQQLDFSGETEISRKTINLWVEDKTEDKIKELIPPDGVNEEIELVLTNAIYFKGEWKHKFDKSQTRDVIFFISPETNVNVPMMYVEQNFKYYEDDKLQALELPYKGDEISMLLLLPRQREGLREIENTLTAELLDVIELKMITLKTDVYIPRFKMTWGTMSLKEVLIALGMADAFDPEKADFSGIIEQGNLFISDVFHKAFVEVDEEGTEAAAATATMIAKGDIIFAANHPFIFIIKDNRSGSILFIGRLVNPAEQE